MTTVMCLVQQGQVPSHMEAGFKQALNRFSLTAFQESAEIDWLVVRKGNGFSAAHPSTALLVSMHVHQRLEHDERKRFMQQLIALCKGHTNVALSDTVVSIRSPKQRR